MSEKNKIPQEIKDIILWELETKVPPNLKLSIGHKGVFTRDQLKKEVEEESEVGKLYADMQLRFMRALAKGDVSASLATVEN